MKTFASRLYADRKLGFSFAKVVDVAQVGVNKTQTKNVQNSLGAVNCTAIVSKSGRTYFFAQLRG